MSENCACVAPTKPRCVCWFRMLTNTIRSFFLQTSEALHVFEICVCVCVFFWFKLGWHFATIWWLGERLNAFRRVCHAYFEPKNKNKKTYPHLEIHALWRDNQRVFRLHSHLKVGIRLRGKCMLFLCDVQIVRTGFVAKEVARWWWVGLHWTMRDSDVGAR